MNNDPVRHSAEDIALRASFARMEASRQARFAELDQRLAAHGKQVTAILEAAREQQAVSTTETVAEPAELAPVHMAQVPGPADYAPGSPEHMAARAAAGIGRSSNHFV